MLRYSVLRTPVLLAVTLMTGSAGAADVSRIQLEAGQREAAGIRVESIRAVGSDAPNADTAGLKLPGRVVLPNSRQDVLLANVGGRVESVLLNAGDSVRAGQPLLRIHSGELLALQRAYLTARAQAEVAAQRVTRDEALHQDGVIAASRLEATRADGVQAQATLREQRQLLRLSGMGDAALDALKSPEAMSPVLPLSARRAGRILSIDVRAGDRVEVGTPLASVAALDELWVDLQATREQARQLAVGDVAQLPGCDVRGSVIAAGVQLDPTSQTTTARARFRGAGHCVAPNQYVQVAIAAAKSAAGLVAVPATSLLHYGGKDAVFIEDGAAFRLVDVKVERYQGKQAWLRDEALQGAKVVTSGVAALKGRWQGLGMTAGIKGTD